MVPLSPAVSEPAEPAAGVCQPGPGAHMSASLGCFIHPSVHGFPHPDLQAEPLTPDAGEPLTPDAGRRPQEVAVDPGGPLEVDIFVIQPLF